MNFFKGIFCNVIVMFWIVRATVVHDLWQELFVTRGYNPKVRPNSDPFRITEVYVNLHLMSIHGLDEVSETLTTSSYLAVHWQDDFLVWDPSYYYGLTVERWPQDDVWKPDLSVRNSVKKYAQLGDSGLYVENYYYGEIVWYLMEVFDTTCTVDTTYYPFDVQNCQLRFTSWSYTKDALYLSNLNEEIKLDNYSPSPQWEILSTSAGIENNTKPETVIYFSIKMKRKPQHHLMTLFLPIILLAVLEVFVFALPSDSGEKSGYSVTVFLAFAVFLTIVETTMPANSDKISIFSVYLLIQTVQSTVITIISLCLIRCASLDGKRKVPRMLVSLAALPRQCCIRKRYVKQNKINIQETNMEIISGKEGEDKRKEEDDIEQETTSVEAKQTETFTWKLFADSMDKLCFIVFLSMFVITTIVCFSILLAAPK